MPAILDPDKGTYYLPKPSVRSQGDAGRDRPPSKGSGINLSKFLTGYPLVAARAARANKIPISLFLAQIQAESGFDPTAVSPAGALGIAQFMPATAAGVGVNPLDPIAALKASAKHNAANYAKSKNWYDVLSLYNSGKGWEKGQGIEETRNYVNKIMSAASLPFGGVTSKQHMAKLFPIFGKQPISWGGGPDAHGSRPLGNWQSDNAYDLMSPAGTPVYSVAKGMINPNAGFGAQNSSNPKVYGSRLNLDVPGPNELFYTHLSKIAPGISPGTKVTPGQLLGWTADYGNADHVHFGAKYGDPKAWLQGKFAPLGVGPTFTPQQDYSSGMIDTQYGPAPANVVQGVQARISPVVDAMNAATQGAYGAPIQQGLDSLSGAGGPIGVAAKKKKKNPNVDELLANLMFMEGKLPGVTP